MCLMMIQEGMHTERCMPLPSCVPHLFVHGAHETRNARRRVRAGTG